ncbi:MAG: outer membrane protein transport protein [Bacteroidales bacterium]|nr:outer membrane protein transport protein [Bacteroidales bacterium]
MGRYHFFITLSFIVLLLFVFGIVTSQNGHYWTQQYGNKSMLLSGSVIGGVDDLGAIYYNPARLSQIESRAFLLSADLYEYNSMKIIDAFGDNSDISNSSFNALPGIAAGRFSLPFLKKHSFGWAILTRQNSDLNISYQTKGNGDVIKSSMGGEFYGTSISISNRLKEQWFGFSWAYPVTDRLSVGASNFLSLGSQEKGNFVNLYTLTSANEIAFYRENKNVNYNRYGLLTKVGISYKLKKTVLGFTFKTPQLNLSGSGRYSSEVIFLGIENIHKGSDELTTTSQDGLELNYRTPLSVGLGISHTFKKNKIHFSAEYFASNGQYSLIKSKGYESQSSGEIYQFELIEKTNDIFNIGIGIEMQVNDNISVYGSTSTDFSSVASDINSFIGNKTLISNSIISADYFHFGGGIEFRIRRTEITLGASYTGAQQQLDNVFHYPNNENELGVISDRQGKLIWDRWRFMFSFSIPFLKDIQRKIEGKVNW